MPLHSCFSITALKKKLTDIKIFTKQNYFDNDKYSELIIVHHLLAYMVLKTSMFLVIAHPLYAR